MSVTPVYYVTLKDLRKRLNEFPIKLEIPDPVSGELVTFDRENVFIQCFVKADQLILDAQTVSALFMEASRIQRACVRAAAQAESAFAQWKAQAFAAAKATKGKEKPITDKAAEAVYRTQHEYNEMAASGPYFRNIADLMSDLKQAMILKGRMIENLTKQMSGYEYTQKIVEHDDEGESLEELDAMVAVSIEESRGAKAAPSSASVPPVIPPPPPPPPVVEDEEEEEEEATEEEEADPDNWLGPDEVCAECDKNPCE